MIKRTIGLAPGIALALTATIMPGPASAASSARPGGTVPAAARVPAGSVPVAWVANGSPRSARKGSVTPINTATNTAGKPIKTGLAPLAIAIGP